MIHTTAIALFLGIWASIYLIDSYLRQRFVAAYDNLLERYGISFGICQIRWATASANRILFKIGQCRPKALSVWFDLGVLFSVISMPVAVLILGHSLLQHVPAGLLSPWSASSSSPADVGTTTTHSTAPILAPVMPGINLPFNQFSYYMITLLFCGVLHEFGHAVAAVRENVRLYECGVFLFAIYPGAYVKLNSEQIGSIKPLPQLRIYCAGIWHNFVMVLAAVAVLILLPWLLSAAFDIRGRGVVVTEVVKGSVVSGALGLFPGDVIISLDDCPIHNSRDWFSCIKESMKEEVSKGRCLSIDELTAPEAVGSIYRNGSAQVYFDDFGIAQCCKSNVTNSHICFSYKVKSNLRYSCQSARKTTLRPHCSKHSECQSHSGVQESQRRPRGPYHLYCVEPAVGNLTRLLRVKRSTTSIYLESTMGPRQDNDVLFFGYPLDLYFSVTLSDYVPKSAYIPYSLPYVIATYCKYVISLSGALALLNVVPCYELDGQYILKAALDYALKDVCRVSLITAIYKFCMTTCTSLLLLNLVLALKTLLFM